VMGKDDIIYVHPSLLRITVAMGNDDISITRRYCEIRTVVRISSGAPL
jgi:hypothetical protein